MEIPTPKLAGVTINNRMSCVTEKKCCKYGKPEHVVQHGDQRKTQKQNRHDRLRRQMKTTEERETRFINASKGMEVACWLYRMWPFITYANMYR